MKRAWLVLPFWLIILLSGCVNTRIIPYETTIRAPKSENYPIEILERAGITRSYKVIGEVEANAGKNHDPIDTLEHLKREARKMGGDALMDLQRGQGAGGMAGHVGGGVFVYGKVREIWSAKVIIWE